MRLPVDRRRPVPHPRDPFVGAGRPLPARARHLGLAEKLGTDAPRAVSEATHMRGAPCRRIAYRTSALFEGHDGSKVEAMTTLLLAFTTRMRRPDRWRSRRKG